MLGGIEVNWLTQIHVILEVKFGGDPVSIANNFTLGFCWRIVNNISKKWLTWLTYKFMTCFCFNFVLLRQTLSLKHFEETTFLFFKLFSNFFFLSHWLLILVLSRMHRIYFAEQSAQHLKKQKNYMLNNFFP